MIKLTKIEQEILDYIKRNETGITDYQLNRFLINRVDPSELLEIRQWLRNQKIIEVYEQEGFRYWKIKDESRLVSKVIREQNGDESEGSEPEKR